MMLYEPTIMERYHAHAFALIHHYTIETKHIPLANIGVHPFHWAVRRGQYPNGDRVEMLINDVLTVGIVANECRTVCVQEFAEDGPHAHLRRFHDSNVFHSQHRPKLQNCFDGSTDICEYGCLDHTHLILGLKCIVNQAGLDWPHEYATAFNRTDGIDIEQINQRWPQLHELLTKGIEMTVLSSRIMVDFGPRACWLISGYQNNMWNRASPQLRTMTLQYQSEVANDVGKVANVIRYLRASEERRRGAAWRRQRRMRLL